MPLSDYGALSLLQVSRMPKAHARKIYSELRSVANKRISRLANSEFTNTQRYLANKAGFPKLKEISDKELIHILPDLTKFVYGNTTVTGMRLEAIRGANDLHDERYHGIFDFVTPENYFTVIDMLNYYHSTNLARLYDSEAAITLANEVSKKFNNRAEVYKHFEFWLEHSDELSVTERTKTGKPTGSAVQWRNALGIKRYDD